LHDGSTLRGIGVNGGYSRTATVDPGASVTLATGSNSTDQLAFNGASSRLAGGSGATVHVTGAGVISMQQTSTYSGAWSVDSGTLDVRNGVTPTGSGTSPLLVNTGAVLQLQFVPNGGGTFMRDITLNGGSTLRSLTTDNIISGAILLNAGTETADVATGTTLTLSGSVSGSGTLIHAGAGNLNFSINSGSSLTISGSNITTSSVVNNGTFSVSSGTLTTTTLTAGNDGTLTSGSGSGSISLSGGTITASSVYLGSTLGGSATLTVSGLADFKLDRLAANDFIVNGGSVTVGVPQSSVDPVLDASLVGGYLRDGAIHIHGGTVTTPSIKLGVTSGYTGTYTQDGGSVTVGTFGLGNDGTISGGTGVAVVTLSGGTLNATNLVFGSTAGGRGTMNLAPSANVTPKVATISFNGGNQNPSRLDVSDNKLIVTATPIGSATGGVYDGVNGLVQSGRNGGTWDGSGIVTSQSDAALNRQYTSLAVATAAQAGKNSFGGISVSASEVLVMYTWTGDANLDGRVDADDYFQIDSNYNKPAGSGWFNGDFNYDGKVNGDDYFLIDNAFAHQNAVFSGAPVPLGATAVPEPAVLPALALMALSWRRRRTKRSRTSGDCGRRIW